MMQSRTITPRQAAEFYNLNLGTLANYRSQKKGPPYLRVYGKILYRVDQFEAWLFSNPVKTMDSIEERP